MADQKPQEQKQEQKADGKLNKDGFVKGARVTPDQLAEFKLKQRQKARK